MRAASGRRYATNSSETPRARSSPIASQVSRIVPFLAEGAGVVTSRADVHWVVTEWGAARLHGRTLRERAEALVEIAHPRFRDELRSASRARFPATPRV